MEYEINELVYMSHFADEIVEKALFKHFEGLLVYIVNEELKAFQCLMMYRDDLIQEAWISLYHALDYYRNDRNTSFNTFMSLVVKRSIKRAINVYLSEGPYKNNQVYSLDNCINEASFTYGLKSNNPMFEPEYYLDYKEAEEAWLKLINNLNDKEKDTLRLWAKGKKYKEAAEELNISFKTYDGRKQSLRKRIKNEFINR